MEQAWITLVLISFNEAHNQACKDREEIQSYGFEFGAKHIAYLKREGRSDEQDRRRMYWIPTRGRSDLVGIWKFVHLARASEAPNTRSCFDAITTPEAPSQTKYIYVSTYLPKAGPEASAITPSHAQEKAGSHQAL